MKDLTLLIGTCDAYSMLWDNFVTLTDRYWKIDCRKLFVSENKKVEYTGYDFHLPGKLNWSNRMLSAIDTINTEYTFFVLEDYFFTETLDDRELLLHIDFMKHVDANKVMLEYKCKHLTLIDQGTWRGRTTYKLSPFSNYLTSVQPSVWKTEHLKKVMQLDWSPWEFEIKGSDAIRGKESSTYLMLRNKKPYWNAVRRGLTMSPGWEEIKAKENLQEMNLIIINKN